MTEQKRPTLTLRRNTEPARNDTRDPAAEEKGESERQVTRKKRVVVSSPPAWKVKKQALEEKEKAAHKAEKARLWAERQEQEKAARQAEKRKPAPLPVYREIMSLQEAVSLLHSGWPALVLDGRPQLLAVNIRQALIDDIRQRGLDISIKKLKRCLAAITRSDGYLDAMQEGGWRKNRDGQPVAMVTADEAAFAQERKAQEHARAVRRLAFEQQRAERKTENEQSTGEP